MPSQELASFHKRLSGINLTRSRMENIFEQNRLIKRDIEAVYEGLFLRAVTNFEQYIEQLFVSVLMRSTSHPPSRAKPIIKVLYRTDLRKILLREALYLEWLPYNKTLTRAHLYLRDGKPFSELDDGEKSRLKQITTIRNAIAHRSAHARGQFSKDIIANMSLLKNEKTPAGFLRSQLRSSPRQIRFEMYVGELGRIAQKLSSPI